MADFRMHWFPLDAVEILTDSKFLAMEPDELGAFIRLACHRFVRGFLPDEINSLSRVAGVQFDATACDGNAFLQDRILTLAGVASAWISNIEDAQQRHIAAKSAKASESAKARWNKDKGSERIQPHSGRMRSNAKEQHSTGKNSTEQTTTPPLPPEGFEAFWKAYPKKTARGNCEMWWKRNKPDDATLTQMLHALEWQRISADWKKEGGKYIPHPQTWLNGKRWLDEKRTGGGDDREAAKERFLASFKPDQEQERDIPF